MREWRDGPPILLNKGMAGRRGGMPPPSLMQLRGFWNDHFSPTIPLIEHGFPLTMPPPGHASPIEHGFSMTMPPLRPCHASSIEHGSSTTRPPSGHVSPVMPPGHAFPSEPGLLRPQVRGLIECRGQVQAQQGSQSYPPGLVAVGPLAAIQDVLQLAK